MLRGAYSGTLLDSDLLGASPGFGGPTFLGSSEDAGAACDPAIFLIDDSEPEAPPAANCTNATAGNAATTAGTACGLGLPLTGKSPTEPANRATVTVSQRHWASSAQDILQELENSIDFILPSQSIDSLLLGGNGGDEWRHSPPAPSPTTPASNWQTSAPFPAIPEEAELPQSQLAAPLPASSPLNSALSPTSLSRQPPHSLGLFVPVPAPSAIPTAPYPLTLSISPASGADPIGSSSPSEAASPTASSTSSLHGLAAAHTSAGYPRIASMPNLHLSLGELGGGETTPAQTPRKKASAASRSRGLPRSRSHSDLRAVGGAGAGAGSAGGSELDRYNVPHLHFLTPPHLRKGKGGRQPAADPRLDPNIDPKRARRIMANRLSAAKSKMKQKSSSLAETQKSEMLRLQREGHLPDMSAVSPMESSPEPQALPRTF